MFLHPGDDGHRVIPLSYAGEIIKIRDSMRKYPCISDIGITIPELFKVAKNEMKKPLVWPFAGAL